MCKKPTTWEALLERKKVDGKTVYKCKTCEKDTFKNLESFIEHALTHTGEKTYICRLPGCTKAFCSLKRLRDHLKWGLHEKQGEFKCEICETTFSKEISLRSHMSWHKRVQDQRDLVTQNTLENGGTVYDGDLDIKNLIEFHRKMSEKPTSWQKIRERIKVNGNYIHKCKICEKSYKNYRPFMQHALRHHTAEKTYICRFPGCSKTYYDWPLLQTHLLSHCGKDKRKHKCDYCSSTFRTNCEKISHEKLHNPGNEALRKCELCESAFLSVQRLYSHLRKEHGVAVVNESKRKILDEEGKTEQMKEKKMKML